MKGNRGVIVELEGNEAQSVLKVIVRVKKKEIFVVRSLIPYPMAHTYAFIRKFG